MPLKTITINTETHKVVPLDPTKNMYEHGVMAKDVIFTMGAGLNTAYFPVGAIWQAMINAAPEYKGDPLPEIDGLYDAVSVDSLPIPSTDEECDNIVRRYEDHRDIYGCEVSETIAKAAKAYLKLTRP